MKHWLIAGWFFAATPVLQAADPGRLLAFAVENRLSMAIGKFEPGRGWVQSTDFYAPPQPRDSFTLYTPSGYRALVTIQENRSPVKDDTFAGWSVLVSSWNNRSDPFALAVAGSAPLNSDGLEPISTDNAEAGTIVSRYLTEHGLPIEHPLLTQAYQIPVQGQDRQERILIAHSDASRLVTDQEESVYAVALLWWKDHGSEKVLPLASQTSLKPPGRTRDEHEHPYGTRDFLRLIAAPDIDGDGWRELVLYTAKDDATQIDVFSFNGRRLRKVLSAYKPNYN